MYKAYMKCSQNEVFRYQKSNFHLICIKTNEIDLSLRSRLYVPWSRHTYYFMSLYQGHRNFPPDGLAPPMSAYQTRRKGTALSPRFGIFRYKKSHQEGEIGSRSLYRRQNRRFQQIPMHVNLLRVPSLRNWVGRPGSQSLNPKKDRDTFL